MATTQMDVRVQPRWGFWNIITSAMGVLLVVGLLLYAFFRAFLWVWPTLMWLLPVSLYVGFTAWMLYKSTQIPDEVARSHRQYQTVIVVLRTFILLIIFFANTRSVGP